MLHSPDKNRSKKGCPPSKTLKDCKALTRLRPMPSNGSSDFTGESDDDHEEIYFAAAAACNASSMHLSLLWLKRHCHTYVHISASSMHLALYDTKRHICNHTLHP